MTENNEKVTASQIQAVATDLDTPRHKSDNKALADFWHDVIINSGLSGLEQQLAKNCALVKKTDAKDGAEQVFELLLESIHKNLLSDKIRSRLADNLGQFFQKRIILDIKECQPRETLETPGRREQHEAKILQQQAIESILTDPKVKLLEDAFGAEVKKESIKPLPST